MTLFMSTNKIKAAMTRLAANREALRNYFARYIVWD